MKNFWNSICILLLWMLYGIEAQSSYYRREYYNPLPTRYFRRNNGFAPINYRHDLISEESKHKVSSKKYSKPIPNRTSYPSDEEDYSHEHYTSGEYSNESRGFNSQEQDSREYSIGTQIRVQHPITVPKKITSSSHSKHPKLINNHNANNPAHSFGGELSLSTEIHAPETPTALPLRKHPSKFTQLYEPDPFHVIPPPRATSPAVAASSHHLGYNVYEPELDDYQPSRKQIDRFKNVASKKQIEKFLEDQQKKLLDEALKIQLLNNPEFKEFLKAKEKKRYEKESYDDEDSLILPPHSSAPVFHETYEDGITFTTLRPRRRPSELKRSPKRKPGVGKPKRKFRSAIIIDA